MVGFNSTTKVHYPKILTKEVEMTETEMQEWFELSGRELDPVVGVKVMEAAALLEDAYKNESDDRLSNALEAMMDATYQNYPPTLGEIFEGGERVQDILIGWYVWNAVFRNTLVVHQIDWYNMIPHMENSSMWEAFRRQEWVGWDGMYELLEEIAALPV